MKSIRNILIFLAFFFSLSPARAEFYGGRGCASDELLVNIAVTRYEGDQGLVCPSSDPQRRAFLFVNAKATIFNPDQLNNLYGPSTFDYCTSDNDGSRTWGLWRGCVARSVFKARGQNSFNFNVCSLDANGNCSSATYVNKSYQVEIQNESGRFLDLFNFSIKGIGVNLNFNCTQNYGQVVSGEKCAETIGSETLLPETMAEINRLLNESDQIRRDAVAKTLAAIKRVEEAEKLLKSIEGKTFDQLTMEELAAFTDALAILRTERENASKLRSEVEQQLEAIRTSINEAQSKAKLDLASLGIDVDDSSTYEDLVDFEIYPAPLPQLPVADLIDPNDNVYKLLADKSLEAMNKSLESKNRIEFLRVTLSWSEKNKALLDLYRSRLVASEAERAEYVMQTRRVEDFLYGANGQTGILDRNGWFKDSIVPVDIQHTIDSMLARDANDPFAIWLKQTFRPLPGQQATIDSNTYSLIMLSYSLVTYFNEFRKIYDEAVAQGYRPPPAVPPTAGQAKEYAGYSWDALTREYFANQRAIEEIKKVGVMGIDLYISTSIASPLVSFCRILSGNSTCRFDGEKDLKGWDYAFSTVDSLVLLAPLVGVVSALKSLPSIGGKIFSATAKTLAVIEQIKTAALELGLKATQETIDFVYLLGKAGVKKAEDFVEYVKYLRLSKSAKEYVKIAKSTEGIEKLVAKIKVLPDAAVDDFYVRVMISPGVGEIKEDVYLVRYYGLYDFNEVPLINGKPQPGAAQKGGFWGNSLYLSEPTFREGSVVFPEWNSAKRLTQIKVKKGTKVVFGKGKGQTLPANATFNGVESHLPDSPDWQFSFPYDPDWVAQGNDPRNWVNHLFEIGQLEIVTDVPTGWKP